MAIRSFVFTLNNYEEEDVRVLKEFNCRYLIGGFELSESGTKHIQGYCELHKPAKFAGIKNKMKKAHIEKRMGTREQAREYCMKEGNYFEVGDWKAGGQGKRNDLELVMKLAKDKVPMLQIAEEAPSTFARHSKFIKEYKGLIEQEESKVFRILNVEVHWGKAGTGKTRYAMETYPNIYVVNPQDSFPFDGYDGEKEILIDDFNGTIKYDFLLRILDGHRLRLNTKFGHRYAVYNTVIITSNKKPEKWYERGYTEALKRRINLVKKYTVT